MWKYLSGVSPPPPKKQAKYDKTKSEQNRERKFLAKWETRKDGSRREWLGFDEQEEVMFCRVCWAHATSHERSLVFVTGSKSLKCDSITKHEISDVHKRCQEIEDAKQRGGSAAGETLKRMLTSAQALKVNTLFRTAHALAKNSRPFTDFEWMCE